jgi:hypothetical protein
MIGLVVLTLMNLLFNFIILFVITIRKEIHKLLIEVTKDESKKNELKEKINRDKLFASMIKNFRNMNR